MGGIFIGTLVLWVLKAVLVNPITNLIVSRRMAVAGAGDATVNELARSSARLAGKGKRPGCISSAM